MPSQWPCRQHVGPGWLLQEAGDITGFITQAGTLGKGKGGGGWFAVSPPPSPSRGVGEETDGPI